MGLGEALRRNPPGKEVVSVRTGERGVLAEFPNLGDGEHVSGEPSLIQIEDPVRAAQFTPGVGVMISLVFFRLRVRVQFSNFNFRLQEYLTQILLSN